MQRRSFLAAVAALPIFGFQKTPRDLSMWTDYPVKLTEPIEPYFIKVMMDFGNVMVGSLTFSYKLEPYVNPGHGRIPERFITKYVDIHDDRTKGLCHTVPLKCESHDKNDFVKIVMREHKGLPTEFYEIWDGEHNNLWAVIGDQKLPKKDVFLCQDGLDFIRGKS